MTLFLGFSDEPSRPKIAWVTNQMKHSLWGELWQVEIAETISNVMYGGYPAPALHAALWVGAFWKGTPRSALKIREWHARKEEGDAQGSSVPLCCLPEVLSLAIVSCFVLCLGFLIMGLVNTLPSEFFSCQYYSEVEMWIKHRRSFQSTISVHRRIQGSSKASQNPQDTGTIL